jgi:hypothetical protein
VAVLLAGFLLLRPDGSAVQPVDAWTAVPLPQDSVLIARAEATCGNGVVSDKTLASRPIDFGLPFSVVDGRGNGAVALFTDGTNNATCRFYWDRSGTVGSATSSYGRFTSTDSSRLDFLIGAGGSDSFDMVIGHSGTLATTVDVELESGADVTASLGHGFYLAWWPERGKILRIVARDATGAISGELDQPHF